MGYGENQMHNAVKMTQSQVDRFMLGFLDGDERYVEIDYRMSLEQMNRKMLEAGAVDELPPVLNSFSFKVKGEGRVRVRIHTLTITVHTLTPDILQEIGRVQLEPSRLEHQLAVAAKWPHLHATTRMIQLGTIANAPGEEHGVRGCVTGLYQTRMLMPWYEPANGWDPGTQFLLIGKEQRLAL